MPESSKPPVVINLIGPNAPRGAAWCATCCILYLGEVSSDKQVQESAQLVVKDAIEAGIDHVNFQLPPSWRQLNPAITVAGSVHFPCPPDGPYLPMPVCWIHLQGAKPLGKTINSKENGS